MRTSFSTIIAMGFILAGCSPTGKGPLTFQPPAGWKVERQTLGGLHFYSLTANSPDGGLLMFSQWPPPSKPEDIPTILKQIADGFLKESKKPSGLTLANEQYHIEQFAGEQCQGSYAAF